MGKILITGGAGFIGSNLAKKFHRNHEVFIIDDLSMGKKENIENLSNIFFYNKSVLDREFLEEILLEEDFDYIFHLAAVASVADSVQRPIETHKVNFDSTITILETIRSMKKRNLKKLVFASSAAVYGDAPGLPKKEDSTIKPLSPYAIDKYSSEKYVLIYNDLYGVPTSAVRFFNVYGPNQNPSSPYSGVISIITDKYQSKINSAEAEFNLFGDGNQSRDFVYVKDVVQALELIAFSSESSGNVYNVGTGEETTINELLVLFSEIFNTEIIINKFNKRDGDIENSIADINKLKQIGYEPKFSVREGLKEYISDLILIK